MVSFDDFHVHWAIGDQRISLLQWQILIIFRIIQEIVAEDKISCRASDWSEVSFYWNTSSHFAIIAVSKFGISVPRLERYEPCKWSRNSNTASNIRPEADGCTIGRYNPWLSTWTASTSMLFVPRVFGVSKDIIVGFDGFAALRDVGSDEGNEPHFPNHQCKVTIFFWEGVDFGDEPNICLSIFHEHSLLHASRHPIKRWIAVRFIASRAPTFFFIIISLPLVITFFCFIQGLLKHLIQHIVILNPYIHCVFDKCVQDFQRSNFPWVNHVSQCIGIALANPLFLYLKDFWKGKLIIPSGLVHSSVEIISDALGLLESSFFLWRRKPHSNKHYKHWMTYNKRIRKMLKRILGSKNTRIQNNHW